MQSYLRGEQTDIKQHNKTMNLVVSMLVCETNENYLEIDFNMMKRIAILFM